MSNGNPVAKAVQATRCLDPEYLDQTLAMRAEESSSATGSVVTGVDETELETLLMEADWEEYSHPDLMEGTRGFWAPIPGRIGVVDLSGLPSDVLVRLDDRKDTGKVSAVISGIRGQEVSYTVAILGRDDPDSEEILFTFHPGEPVRPSRVETQQGMHGVQLAVSEALTMGLETAKIE